MCENPLSEASESPATAPEKKLDDVDHIFAREPQEEGMMQYRRSFPFITKLRVSDPVVLGEGLARCQRRRLR